MLARLLLFAFILFVLWRAWRSFTIGAPTSRRQDRTPGQAAGPMTQVEDMVQCPTCGTYVTASSRACGRPDCPRRR
ncbi:MAG TPA: hypothetical protein VM689_12145 [Aliidongia sp.]|nr:hypothetical protein [Aliidongia sp.]